MNRLNKTESAVFLYCRISISEVSVFLIIKRSQQLSFRNVDLVKFLSVYRYSVDILFHILVLREYWVLEASKSIAKSGAIGRENCCTFC